MAVCNIIVVGAIIASDFLENVASRLDCMEEIKGSQGTESSGGGRERERESEKYEYELKSKKETEESEGDGIQIEKVQKVERSQGPPDWSGIN